MKINIHLSLKGKLVKNFLLTRFYSASLIEAKVPKLLACHPHFRKKGITHYPSGNLFVKLANRQCALIASKVNLPPGSFQHPLAIRIQLIQLALGNSIVRHYSFFSYLF